MAEKTNGAVDLSELIRKHSNSEVADRKSGPKTSVRNVTKTNFHDIMDQAFNIPKGEIEKYNAALTEFENSFVEVLGEDLKENIEAARKQGVNDLTDYRVEGTHTDSHMRTKISIDPLKVYTNPQSGEQVNKFGVVSVKGTLVKRNMHDTFEKISTDIEKMLS